MSGARVVALSVAVALVALAARATHAIEVPEALTDAEFWSLVGMLSEPEGQFFATNLVSNEMSFVQTVPPLRARAAPTGVYLGVGPEQNFTYIAALRPRMAFIIDIRRGNLLLHLMYRALFDLSDTRAAFVSRLFGRGLPNEPSTATATELMADGTQAARVSGSEEAANLDAMLKDLTRAHGFPLTAADQGDIGRMYRAFVTWGPGIDYATADIGHPSGGQTFAALMAQTDRAGHELSFLASDDDFDRVRDLERRNLLVPVVGNFAGPHALRAIGAYVKDHADLVTVFYISNVEDYLAGTAKVPYQNGAWQDFCRNVLTLPIAPDAAFMRPLGFVVPAGEHGFKVLTDMAMGQADAKARTVATEADVPAGLASMVADTQPCRSDDR